MANAIDRMAGLHTRFCRGDGSTRLLDAFNFGLLATCPSASMPCPTDIEAAISLVRRHLPPDRRTLT
eukprot:15448079-Alexandrium_andersonii.AAC.1